MDEKYEKDHYTEEWVKRSNGDAPAGKRWLVVGGRTGSGKTRLLERTDVAIDLEGRAHHRG